MDKQKGRKPLFEVSKMPDPASQGRLTEIEKGKSNPGEQGSIAPKTPREKCSRREPLASLPKGKSQQTNYADDQHG